MRAPGEILLISCYELGHQPLGIAGPLGFLEQAGYVPTAVDVSIQPLEAGVCSRARFVGISVPMHTALRIGAKVARRIREVNPSCHICFFGLYSSLNADYLLGDLADSVVGGEYELPLKQLIRSLEDGRSQPIAGVRRRGGAEPPLLDHIPFVPPGRASLAPLDRYAQFEADGQRKMVGYVEASRGCRHLCRHCPIPPVYRGRFFLVPQETVLEDIRGLVRLGAGHVTFGDPDFFNGPNHALRVVKAMRMEFPRITFDFTAKVEHLLRHRNLLPQFADLGCAFIVSAVESLNDTVLERLAKNHTRADVFELLRVARGCGIPLRPSLVTFTPWSDLKDVIELFHVAEAEGLIDHIDPVQYTIRLLIPPGSLLLGEPLRAPHLGQLVEESFSYQWAHPDPRMDALQRLFSEEVERATAAQEDAGTVFFQLRELAMAMAEGRPPERVVRSLQAGRPRPPRLTEPWFCCAEPTENQLEFLADGEKAI